MKALLTGLVALSFELVVESEHPLLSVNRDHEPCNAPLTPSLSHRMGEGGRRPGEGRFMESHAAATDRTGPISLGNMRTLSAASQTTALLPSAATRVVSSVGDRSVVLHWGRHPGELPAGYHVYRSTTTNLPSINFTRITASPVAGRSFADLDVTNAQTYFYYVRAVNQNQLEGANTATITATPWPFNDDAEFLEYVQRTAFDYFWYEANPANGLVRDRSEPASPSSIAAVGFGLTALGIGIDHGWITRAEGRDRTLTTLRTFWEKPQGTNIAGAIGYQGWFYHFLDMNTALRSWASELSSIDTALFLAGVLYARQYFNGRDGNEANIRSIADAIFNRVDWNWMAKGGESLTHGWKPESGFIPNRWIGYNEAMILYVMGIGATRNAIPTSHWNTWTSGYRWETNHNHRFVHFAPLFGHQYSHCWIDFRFIADDYMNRKGLTYFENSRRATLAQREYAIANPSGFPGYSSNLWGLTACDGPGSRGFFAYMARGTPPPENDDGTIAPTAAAGSMPFTPEYSLPALRHMYERFRTNIWTGYGFRDAFNLKANWWDPDVLGIDQGPIIIMIENYRTGRVWSLFKKNEQIQRGLRRAGFNKVSDLR